MDAVCPTPVFARKNVAFACATLCCLLWGSSYPAIKSGYEIFQIATDDIPSKMVFAGYRFLFAGLLLLLLAIAQRKPVARLNTRQYGQLALLGLTQTTLQYAFFYIGLAFTTGVKGSIMNATGTFFSVLLAHFIYHNDKLSYNKAIGCVLGFAGVMIVNFNGGISDFTFTLLGDGFVVFAAFILSASTLYGKRISQTVDPTVMTGYQLGFWRRGTHRDWLCDRGNAAGTRPGIGGDFRLFDAAFIRCFRVVEHPVEIQPRQYDCTV
ncbi:transmembrane protein [Atlantibacter hermannii]|nr:transmembrane protein [Atlantibacter hermannii]